MLAFPPADAVADALIVRIIVEIAGDEQPGFGFAVSVRTTFPVWPVVGVYVGIRVVAFVSTPGPGAVQRILA